MAPVPHRPAAIEVLVETLTGTGFRLRVSSFETVLSVKARIQRIEGVPVSQQHLIFQERELSDGASLMESGVDSGSRLQLVVAMRGGPVNTRRLPMYDDITHAEMQQLMEMQSDTPWESDSSGRQVTLLVFREGDQVNFYRVMENTDGTFSPLSDSWGSSIRNMFQEENADDVKRRIDENTTTMSKVMDLKHKMQQMSVRKKGRLPPSRGRPSDQSRGRVTPRPTAATTAPHRIHLPPVSTPTAARSSASFPPSHGDLSESFSRLSRSRRAALRDGREAEVAPAAARGASAASEHERPLLVSRGTLTSRGQVTSGRRRKLSLSESTELFKQMQAQRGLAAARGAAADRTAVPGSGSGAVRDYGAYRRTLSKLARHPSQSEPAEPPSPATELPVLFETDERRAGAPLDRRLAVSAGGRRPRTSPLQYSKDDTDRAVSPALSLRPTDGRARQLCRILSARAAVPAGSPARAVPPTPAAAGAGAGAGTPAAPRQKRPRCQLCRRRLGLAAVYSCHCAGVFCTQHRYPESHQCSYDFKTEGRRLLERANPLVTAPKLPKI